MLMLMFRVGLFFIALFIALDVALAAPLTVGSPWPVLKLADQHDKPVELASPPLQKVVFAVERKPGDWAQAAFEPRKELLASGQTALVLDISRMPALVTSMFAMPSFRAQPFPILVARDAMPVADLPRKEGHVTVISLDGGKLVRIDFAADQAALEQILNRKTAP